MKQFYNKLFGYSEERYLDELRKDHGNIKGLPSEEVESLTNKYRKKSRWQKIGAGVCTAVCVPAISIVGITIYNSPLEFFTTDGNPDLVGLVMASAFPLALSLGLYDYARDNSKKRKTLEQELEIRSLDGRRFIDKKGNK